MKKKPRLQFTEEERADPTLEKPIAKAEKAADKVDKAQAKIPKKTIKTKERTFDAQTGKTKVRLCFEEMDKPKPPSKLSHGIKKAPQKAVLSAVHQKISENEQDNVGLEAAHGTEKAGEFAVRRVQSAYHSHKLKPYRTLAKAEKQSVKADVNALYKKSIRDNPQSASNPLSRFHQKRAIKKQYIATRHGEPKFAACQSQGIPYFSSNGRWANRGYKDIAPGDAIFFDWEGDGSSDHVGIVIGTDGSRVYTVEGNSGDACKVRDYDLNSSVIMGYGLMN